MIVESKYCDCCGKQIGWRAQREAHELSSIKGKAYLIPTWGMYNGDTMDLCNECSEKFANCFDEIWKNSTSSHKAVLNYSGGKKYV